MTSPRRPTRGAVLALVLLARTGYAPAAAPVNLAGPEAYRVDWNTRALTAHDVDGDGLADLVLLNNDRAKVEILYQLARDAPSQRPERRRPARRWVPVLDDARLRADSVVTGEFMYALAMGDLDGDGRADMAFTGKRAPLTVLYQDDDGWERRETFEVDAPVPWASSLAVHDLDGDDRNELVMLASPALLVFRRDADGRLGGPDRYPLADADAFGLTLCDVNGDGRTDILYVVPRGTQQLRLRLQGATGRLGPEQAVRVETPAARLVPLGGGGAEPLFASIQERTRILEILRLTSTVERRRGRDPVLPARVYATSAAAGARASYAVGDLDGDGHLDLALAHDRSPQVQLYRQRPAGGWAEGESYPSLVAIRSLAAGDLDGDGRDELLVASRDDRALGVSRLAPEGRLSYPALLPLDGRPLAVAVADLRGDRAPEVVVLLDSAGVRAAAILSSDDAGATWTETRLEMPDLKTDPLAVRILDANQDGRPDIAVFTPQSPMRLLLQDATGGFADASDRDAFRDDLVNKLLPTALATGDIDADGRAEMLVAGRGFARALRVRQDGALEILDQYNGRDPNVEFTAVLAVDLDTDGAVEVVLAEKDGGGLQVLERDSKGVFRYSRRLSIGSIDLVEARVLKRQAGAGTDLLFLGQDRFWWIPLGETPLRAETVAVRETDLEDTVYRNLAVGDLNADGQEEIIVVDSAVTRILEVLQRRSPGDWESVLHFTLFEQDPHYEGRTGTGDEPREILTADVTGDGRDDLVLLIHDRVLIYPQS